MCSASFAKCILVAALQPEKKLGRNNQITYRMASKPKILTASSDPRCPEISTDYADIMEQHFEIIHHKLFEQHPSKYQDIVAIIWICGPDIDAELLNKLPNVKIVATVSVGYDHLNIPLIRNRGIKLSHTPGVLNDAVAEMGLTLLLASARNLVRFAEEYKRGTYSEQVPVNDVTPQFSGSTLGIVGMGRIGYTLATRAMAFQVKILYNDILRRSTAEEKAIGATYFSNLNEMLPHCDFVIVLVNLTSETTHIMGEKQFKHMKKSAILVNCSRGPTVDQEALVKALKAGEIGGAALDVTTPEPLPNNHELFKMSNVILTPHISYQTRKASNGMMQLAVDNVLAALDGTDLLSEIPY